MALLKPARKNRPHIERVRLQEPSPQKPHPDLDLDQSKSLRQSDLEFDVRDLLSEIRSMTPDERERLIRSYA